MSENKKLIEAINNERKRLYDNKQVPIDELRLLVFVAYACSEISSGKVCEMLSIDLLEFREQWISWVAENPKMQAIFDGVQLPAEM